MVLPKASDVYASLRSQSSQYESTTLRSPYLSQIPHAELFLKPMHDTIINELAYIRHENTHWTQRSTVSILKQVGAPADDWHATLGFWSAPGDTIRDNCDETYHLEILEKQADSSIKHSQIDWTGVSAEEKELFPTQVKNNLLQQYTHYKSLALIQKGQITDFLDWEGQARYLTRLEKYRNETWESLLVFREPSLSALLARDLGTFGSEDVVDVWAKLIQDSLTYIQSYPHAQSEAFVYAFHWREHQSLNLPTLGPPHVALDPIPRWFDHNECVQYLNENSFFPHIPDYTDRYLTGYPDASTNFAWAVRMIACEGQRALVALVDLEPGAFLGILTGYVRWNVDPQRGWLGLPDGVWVEPFAGGPLDGLLERGQGGVNVRFGYEELWDAEMMRPCFRVLAFAGRKIGAYEVLKA